MTDQTASAPVQTMTALEFLRVHNLSMKHIYKLGVQASGTFLPDAELDRRYNGLCSYIAQRAIPSAPQEAILIEGIYAHYAAMGSDLVRITMHSESLMRDEDELLHYVGAPDGKSDEEE